MATTRNRAPVFGWWTVKYFIPHKESGKTWLFARFKVCIVVFVCVYTRIFWKLCMSVSSPWSLPRLLRRLPPITVIRSSLETLWNSSFSTSRLLSKEWQKQPPNKHSRGKADGWTNSLKHCSICLGYRCEQGLGFLFWLGYLFLQGKHPSGIALHLFNNAVG